jgi:hypothetical protein
MGSKTKAPKTKLNAADAITGYVEACEGLILKHSEDIFAYAKKAEDKIVTVKIVGTIDISGGNPKVEVQLYVSRTEKFKDNIVGEIDQDQGKFREILNEAGGEAEEPADTEAAAE